MFTAAILGQSVDASSRFLRTSLDMKTSSHLCDRFSLLTQTESVTGVISDPYKQDHNNLKPVFIRFI